MAHRRSFGIVIIVAGLLGSQAMADDWRMFRKDSGRTAASSESFAFPLKPMWEYKSVRLEPMGAVSTVSTFGPNAYFLAGPAVGASGDSKANPKRSLICADIATGQIKWSQPVTAARLHAFLPEDIGPAVTDSGRVIVADSNIVMRPCPTTMHWFRAYNGESGAPVAEAVIPIKNLLARFFLRQGHGEENFLLESRAKPDQ